MATALESRPSVRPAIVVQGFTNTESDAHSLVVNLRLEGFHAVHPKIRVVSGPFLPPLIEEETAKVEERLIHESDEYGPTELIGYSWGGLYATLAAIREPDRVSGLTTIASPPREAPLRSIRWVGRPLNTFGRIFSSDLRRFAEELHDGTISVPELHIYGGRSDRVVAHRRHCRSDTAEHVHVPDTHEHLLRNPQVSQVIAQRANIYSSSSARVTAV